MERKFGIFIDLMAQVAPRERSVAEIDYLCLFCNYIIVQLLLYIKRDIAGK